MSADTNLVSLIARFGDEDRCRDYLVKLRWPEGVECPRCGSHKIAEVRTRHQYTCKNPDWEGEPCGYRGPRRDDLPGLQAEPDQMVPRRLHRRRVQKGVSAQQLSRMLGVTPKTGWFRATRIRAAMGD